MPIKAATSRQRTDGVFMLGTGIGEGHDGSQKEAPKQSDAELDSLRTLGEFMTPDSAGADRADARVQRSRTGASYQRRATVAKFFSPPGGSQAGAHRLRRLQAYCWRCAGTGRDRPFHARGL